MSKKIVNIITFVITGLACLLALWFAMSFDDNRKDLYYEINTINERNPQMVTDFEAITIATLPDFVAAKTEEKIALEADLKKRQLQQDIFYTYLVELKDLNQDIFSEYKINFSKRSNVLFSKSDHKDKLISGFNTVEDFASLSAYVQSLESEYDVLKQEYLKEKSYVNATANFVKRIFDINSGVSESKKTNELETLQKNVKSSIQENSILNVSVVLFYAVFIIAIAMVLIFSLIGIATSIKSSYQVLIWIAVLILVFVLGYIASSPDLSRSAIAMGHTSSEVKWIGSGVITVYVLLLGAILSIIISPLINKIKKI